MRIQEKATNPQASAWGSWLQWILVCALGPVCYTILGTAFTAEISSTSLYASLASLGILVAVIALPILPTYLEWRVLRQVAPALRFWHWLLIAIIVFAISSGLTVAHMGILKASMTFKSALLAIRLEQGSGILALLAMPWAKGLSEIVVATILTAIVPALALGKTSQYRWYVFLIAACIGACLSLITDRLNDFYFLRVHSLDYALNNVGWKSLLSELAFRASAGATWGIGSGTAFFLLCGHAGAKAPAISITPLPRPRQLIAASIGIIILMPILRYTLGPHGIASGFPAISKALSFAPSREKSEGSTLLSYAYTADITTPQYPVVQFAPDGKSFLVRSADNRLQLLDMATGNQQKQIGEQLRPHENYAVDWSPDGRFLILRTDGPEIKVAGGYSRHQSRLRLYSLPEYRVLGEYSYLAEECFSRYGQSVMFTADSKNAWIHCTQNYTSPKKAQDVMAIRLSVPEMQLLEVRRYGKYSANGEVQGLARLQNGIGYWQTLPDSAAPIHLREFKTDRDVLSLNNLTSSTMAGTLTRQELSAEGARIALRYCGSPNDIVDSSLTMPLPPRVVHAFCRILVFDISSGTLLAKEDYPNVHAPNTHMLRGKNGAPNIEGAWQDSSKTGTLTVLDPRTGRVSQRITGVAQKPIALTPDGKLLITHAFNTNSLRIYRVSQ